MNLCSIGHEEVCYESRRCPVCEMESDKDQAIEKLEGKIEERDEKIVMLEDEIKNLTHEKDAMQDEINGLQSDIRNAEQ